MSKAVITIDEREPSMKNEHKKSVTIFEIGYFN